jgi:hypothetical protein
VGGPVCARAKAQAIVSILSQKRCMTRVRVYQLECVCPSIGHIFDQEVEELREARDILRASAIQQREVPEDNE